MTSNALAATISAPPQSGRRVPFARTVIGPEARAAVERVLASGWVTTGQEALEFERELAGVVGAARGVAVSSCTAGIELCLRGLGLPAGARVLMSTDTFCGAASAITHAGLVPVLCDVDPRTALPTEAQIHASVRAVGGVSAMVVVHLGGQPVDVERAAAAAGLGLDHVIEDAAHALGTNVGDRPVGAISRATCFSFYATKNLAIGEGGMVTTNDEEFADTVVSSRLHGMSRDAWRRYLPGATWRYDVAVDGLKANLTDVQAAIGRAQLRRFAADQARRSQVAARYDSQLRGLRGIRLPPRPAAGRHAWHLYAVRVGPEFGLPRDQLMERLAARGIGTSVHFIPLHRLTWHSRHCVLPDAGLPGADAVFAETLSLPFDQNLNDDEVDEVCTALWETGEQR